MSESSNDKVPFKFRWEQAVLTSTLRTPAKIVAIVLRRYANAEERAWPSVATLAAETSQCRRTVQGALRTLEREGWITASGYEGSAAYRLTMGHTSKLGRGAPDAPLPSAGDAPPAQEMRGGGAGDAQGGAHHMRGGAQEIPLRGASHAPEQSTEPERASERASLTREDIPILAPKAEEPKAEACSPQPNDPPKRQAGWPEPPEVETQPEERMEEAEFWAIVEELKPGYNPGPPRKSLGRYLLRYWRQETILACAAVMQAREVRDPVLYLARMLEGEQRRVTPPPSRPLRRQEPPTLSRSTVPFWRPRPDDEEPPMLPPMVPMLELDDEGAAA